MAVNPCQCKSTKFSQIKSGHQVFTSPEDIAGAFNNHFTNIGETLAREIPTVDIGYFLSKGSMFKKSST